MKKPEIRKVVTHVEEIRMKALKVRKSIKRCYVAAIIKNPLPEDMLKTQ